MLEAFPDRDRFFDRGYMFSRLLFEIEDVCRSYDKEDYANLFLRLKDNGFKLQKHDDKKKIRLFIEKLNTYRCNSSIIETLDFITSSPIQIFQIQDYLYFLKNQNNLEIDPELEISKDIFESIKNIPFKEVSNVFDYIEDNTLYSTKHGVKGTEYENVLVIVDDDAWRNFNDNDVFSYNTNAHRYNRSRNLLYVCCSRAKNRLALFAVTGMNADAQTTINNWFGINNVIRR